jgi:hypothetical protein
MQFTNQISLKILGVSSEGLMKHQAVTLALALALAGCASKPAEPCHTLACMKEAQAVYQLGQACANAIAEARKRSPGVYRMEVITRGPQGKLITCNW